MKVDIYTPIKETASYIARKFNKRVGEDDSMEPITYNIRNLEYKVLKPLLGEMILEVRDSKKGEIIWPKIKKFLEK